MLGASFPLFLATGSIQLTLIRRGNGSYVRGRWVDDSTPDSVTITANVQPVSPKEILMLPESDRTRDAVKVFSKSEIRTAKEGSHVADQFVFDGTTYEVRKVKKWQMGVLDHYWAIAVSVANLEVDEV